VLWFIAFVAAVMTYNAVWYPWTGLGGYYHSALATPVGPLAIGQLFYLAVATPAMAQGRGRGNGGVPPGQRPAAGMCRIWIDGVPPGQQPAPTDCATAAARVPANGRIIYGDRTNGSRRDVYDQNGRVIPRSSQDCVQQIDRNGQVRTVCPYDDRRDGGVYSRRDRDDDEHDRRNHRPRDLERRVAMDMFRFGHPGALPKADQRHDQDELDENEDRDTRPNQNAEENVDFPIEIGALVEDRIRMILSAGGDEYCQRDRQRGLTHRAGTRPARAEVKRHA
jgi:hypothetical protein